MKTTTALFICLGNICRSPMAEGFYNTLTKSKQAQSTGTNPTAHLYYEHPIENTIKVMKEESIDISNYKVKTITEEMVQEADQIIVLCRKDECPDFVVNSGKPTQYWNIPDPFSNSLEKSEIKLKIKF